MRVAIRSMSGNGRNADDLVGVLDLEANTWDSGRIGADLPDGSWALAR